MNMDNMNDLKDSHVDNDIYNMSPYRGRSVSPSGEVSALCRSYFGVIPELFELTGSGSDRRYYRISGPGLPPMVGTWGPDPVENRFFVGLSRCFRSAGISVPEVYVISGDSSVYLQEDLGNVSLLPLLGGECRMELAERSLRQLVAMQTVDGRVWLDQVFMPEFSIRQVMWDLNYFKYEFLKPCGVCVDEEKLEDDFEALAARLGSIPEECRGFMYRDFQSRNVMVRDDELYFIDYQGGRKGPVLYDAVSFLWQAKASFTDDERELLLDKYADCFCSIRNINKEKLLRDIGPVALFRTLQVLGAYGFRGLVEKKAHFIESIPAALGNLKKLISMGCLDPYDELRRVAEVVADSRFSKVDMGKGLTLTVFSFSYKKGYPEDLTGNGGGFMFDCRGMRNPGRYDEYKRLTGIDMPVIDFLEKCGEAQPFVERCVELVYPTIQRYVERKYRNLQIGFGCTGGRHRSVYCAENLSRILSGKFPGIKILLIHRELGTERIVCTGL